MKMNCLIVDDDKISSALLELLVKQVEYLSLVKVCSNPVEAMGILRKDAIDLLFLDIEMPEMSGMELLKNLDKRPQVIFTTSHKEYAVDAFEYNVADYLVKPLTLPRFMKALAKVKQQNDQISIQPSGGAGQDYFFIKKESVLTRVPVKDILWIEALGDYVTIHTKNERFILHLTLKAVESRLPPDKFVRVHRSFIVQLENVKSVEDTTIYINDVSIPVGALYKENFIKRLNLFV